MSGSVNINSLIAKYLTNNNEADFERVSSSIADLTTAFNYQDRYKEMFDNSIFTIDEDISQEKFLDIMSQATGKDASEIEEDVNVLFSVLDNDENGADGSLSASEFKTFLGSDAENVRGFDIWNKLMNINEDEITSAINQIKSDSETQESGENNASGESEATTDSGTTTETGAAGRSSETDESTDVGEAQGADEVDDTDGNETVDESSETDDSGNNNENNGKYDFTNKSEARKFVETFIDDDKLKTPEKVINWLLSIGSVTEEEADLLKRAYANYSDEDQAKIDALMKQGLTYEEAVEELTSSGIISSDNSDLTETVQKPETTISETAAKLYAENLYDSMKGGIFGGLGTDDEQFNSIFYNDDLTPDDWVLIINNYNNSYGSFIKDVDGDFYDTAQDDIQTKIADRLLEAAENGNENAVMLLCSEIYNGTAGISFGTADEFVTRVFDKASDKVLTEIVQNYNNVNNSILLTDIKNDFSFKTEDNIVARINEVIANINDN